MGYQLLKYIIFFNMYAVNLSKKRKDKELNPYSEPSNDKIRNTLSKSFIIALRTLNETLFDSSASIGNNEIVIKFEYNDILYSYNITYDNNLKIISYYECSNYVNLSKIINLNSRNIYENLDGLDALFLKYFLSFNNHLTKK